MNDVLLVSGLAIYTLGLIAVLSYLWGSFVFFKKSREAHFEDNLLLDMIVVSAFWSFMMGRVFYVILNLGVFWNHWSRVFLLSAYPGLDRWGSVIGILVGGFLIMRKKKGKYVDLTDLLSLGFLSGASVFWMSFNLIKFSWQSVLLGAVYLVAFIVLWQLESTYRLISWYRGPKTSARSGFVSGFTLSFLGLVNFLESWIHKNRSVGSLTLSIGLFVVGLVVVYIRSGRVLVDDINSLKIWNKKSKK